MSWQIQYYNSLPCCLCCPLVFAEGQIARSPQHTYNNGNSASDPDRVESIRALEIKGALPSRNTLLRKFNEGLLLINTINCRSVLLLSADFY